MVVFQLLHWHCRIGICHHRSDRHWHRCSGYIRLEPALLYQERWLQVTSVIVLGPNLPDQSKGSFHVHAVGCADINRSPIYQSSEFWGDKQSPMDVNSVEEIAEAVYDFEENPTEYVSDFYVFPCVHFPSDEKEQNMHTVSFEIYTDSFWVEFEVETSNPDIVIQNLLKLKNSRNIHLSK
jgi:hypothetical protein